MTRPVSYNDFIGDVARILRRFLSDSIDSVSLNRLVRLAAQIVIGRLGGRLQAAAAAHGTTAEQEAISCIAELFCYRPAGSSLKKAFEGYTAAGDADLFLRLQAVVVRTARRELFRRWKESDPVGARLWRNLRHALRCDSRVNLIPEDRPEWVIVSGRRETGSALTTIEFAEIEKRVGPGELAENDLPGLAHAILTSMVPVSGDLPAMMLDDFFHAVKKAVMDTAADEIGRGHSPVEVDPLFNLELEDMADKIKNEMETGVDKYVVRRRLNSEMAECFRRALGEVVDDILDGGTVAGYYQYLCAHDPGLKWKVYRRELRGMFEYLAARAKQLVKRRLEREFVR